jgi:hypothetical protein
VISPETSRPICCASGRRVPIGSCGHRRDDRHGESVLLLRRLIEVSSASAFEICIPGGQHSTDVIHQK